jgi:hypothetical protein
MQLFGVPHLEGVWAELTHRGFEVTWEVDGPRPNSQFETFLLSLWLPRPSDGGQLQFGVKFIAPNEVVVFLFDHAAGTQQTLAHTHGLVGGNARQINVYFPIEWVTDFLGSSVNARATANKDGIDRDEAVSCVIDFPETQPDHPDSDRSLADT